MNLKNRLLLLERAIFRPDTLRVVYVLDGTDKTAEHQRQRQQEGYRGPLAVVDETDRALSRWRGI